MAEQPDLKNSSLIGRGITIEGELVDGGDLIIEGCVQGMIRSQGDVQVTAHGRVEATISAQNIVIQGNVCGNLEAKQSVIVQTNGVLIGDCRARTIQIQEGARFEGRSEIIR